MTATPPRNRCSRSPSSRRIGLVLDARFCELVAADCTCICADVPWPHRACVPFLDHETIGFCRGTRRSGFWRWCSGCFGCHDLICTKHFRDTFDGHRDTKATNLGPTVFCQLSPDRKQFGGQERFDRFYGLFVDGEEGWTNT